MAEAGAVQPEKEASIVLGDSSMPEAPSGVLSSPDMGSLQAPDHACCSNDAGSQPGDAL